MVFIILGESFLPNNLGILQSFKIGSLIEHYQQHITESPEEISFNEFLWLHYNPSSKHENQKHDHEKLPSFDSGLSFHIIQNQIEKLEISKNIINQFLKVQFQDFKFSYIYSFSLDFFNPPKI